MRDAFEESLAAAIELDVVEEDKHAALIAAARLCADMLDTEPPKAATLSTYLTYCKALGFVPAQQQEIKVVGSGRLAKVRASSRAHLKAV